MKRFVSAVISIIIVVIFSDSAMIFSSAEDVKQIDSEQFVSELCEMVSEEKSKEANADSAEKVSINQKTPKMEQQDFSSMRLILDCDKNIDTKNAVSVISGFKNIWVLQYSTITDAVNAYNYYCNLPYIKSVEPDVSVTLSNIDNSSTDSGESNFLSWGADFCGFGELLSEIENGHIESTTVSVAVVDTGVDKSHELLRERVEDTYFNVVDRDNETVGSTIDENGHGTHVAGIIADCTSDNVKIRPYKVLDKTGAGYVSLITAGIYRAIEDKVSVINLSLGGKQPSPIQEKAVEYAEENGILVVAAAGNNASVKPVYPACYESVIAVASLDDTGILSKFSNYGEFVDISAPGANIYSTFLNGTFKTKSGTSMATPFVTAACAIAKSIHCDYTNSMVKSLLYSYAEYSEEMEGDNYFYGFGLLNSKGILEKLPENIDDYTIPPAPIFSEKGGIFKDSVDIEISSENFTTIYYTTDGSRPDLNSEIYDGSKLNIEETAEIKAVSYSPSGLRSKTVSEIYYITEPLTEDEITISSEGTIISCNTDKKSVYIPETVNNIVPTKIGIDAFSSRENQNQNIEVLFIPSSVKKIEEYAFYDNDSIKIISAAGAIEVGERAFANCDDFENIQAENLKIIGNSAFYSSGVHSNYYGVFSKYSYFNAVFPSLEYLGDSAFSKSAVNYFEAPQVKSIGQYAFAYSIISSAVCNNLSSIPDSAFYHCQFLMEAEFPKIESIDEYAFASNHSLVKINFPFCTEIETCSFYDCAYLSDLNLPVLKRAAADSFDFCPNIRTMIFPELEEIYLVEAGGSEISLSAKIFSAPKLKSFCSDCFDGQFEYIEIPGVEIIDVDNFGTSKALKYLDISGCTAISSEKAFEYIDNVELILAPSLTSTNSLPDNSSIVVSSSLKNISCQLKEMTFYGIPNSYAEQYAIDNNHTFIPVPYIKSESVPDIISVTDVVKLDTVGFNLSYQWYSSFDGLKENADVIEGETSNILNPNNSKKAPYYFCIVTCEENGIKYTSETRMIQNADFVSADYSALDKEISKIPTDLSKYTDESMHNLNSVLDKIDWHLDVTDQTTVDGYVEAVSNAIAALKLKEHMVSFIVDNESVLSYELVYGSEITDIPPNPEKSGYTFRNWTPDIPKAMPNDSITFTAEFEPVTYYASFMVDGEEIEKVPFTVESESISEPKIPEKEGYTGKWSEYIIAASDITINAEYIINEYTVDFVADDKTIKSEFVEFGLPIKVPDNPQKNGYIFKEWLPKVPETMPAEDMTFYAVFEEEKQPEIKPEVSIRNFVNSRMVDYRTTITFTATVNNMPEGATIIWYKDGQRAGTGEKFTVKEVRETFTVQAKIVDESGNVLNATETELVKVKTDFFSKIIAFFKMLFGRLPVIEQ